MSEKIMSRWHMKCDYSKYATEMHREGESKSMMLLCTTLLLLSVCLSLVSSRWRLILMQVHDLQEL